MHWAARVVVERERGRCSSILLVPAGIHVLVSLRPQHRCVDLAACACILETKLNSGSSLVEANLGNIMYCSDFRGRNLN
jgi:hypothetical protein